MLLLGSLGDDVRSALTSNSRGLLLALVALSALISLLGLTGAIYMMQVYDRVLVSNSIATLIAISALCAGLFVVQGLLDVLRGQILIRIATKFDLALARKAQNAAIRLPLLIGSKASSTQPLRDLETVRGYLSSGGPAALLDLPWTPVFLVFLFAIHPLIGALTLIAVLILVALTILTQMLLQDGTAAVHRTAQSRQAQAAASESSAEAIVAMGFSSQALDRFENANARYLAENHRSSDLLNSLSVISRVFRLMFQSGLLGFGAWLAIQGEMSAGTIIAASVASGRALAPVDALIANWRGFCAAREALPRFNEALSVVAAAPVPLALPPPSKSLRLSSVGVVVPGTQRVVLADITFELTSGTVAAVVGPSAAGKSALARTIAGVWKPTRGQVLLDGASMDRWDRDIFGAHMGYLPQNVELLDGTISENISRFTASPEPQAILAAAEAAGVHELILGLPQGYETPVGPGGAALSAGQRQRIGLARALYGSPFLIVLDEPNSNLDAIGEMALAQALVAIRQRGGIAIVVSHRASILNAVDTVIVIEQGVIKNVGPRNEVLKPRAQRIEPHQSQAAVVASGAGA